MNTKQARLFLWIYKDGRPSKKKKNQERHKAGRKGKWIKVMVNKRLGIQGSPANTERRACLQSNFTPRQFHTSGANLSQPWTWWLLFVSSFIPRHCPRCEKPSSEKLIQNVAVSSVWSRLAGRGWVRVLVWVHLPAITSVFVPGFFKLC